MPGECLTSVCTALAVCRALRHTQWVSSCEPTRGSRRTQGARGSPEAPGALGEHAAHRRLTANSGSTRLPRGSRRTRGARGSPEAHGELGEHAAPRRSAEQPSQWAGLPVTCRDHSPRQGGRNWSSARLRRCPPGQPLPRRPAPSGLAWQLWGPAGGAHAMQEPPAPFP